MMVLWTTARADHIGTRSERYPGGVDIEVAWADEAVADPSAVVLDPDPRSRSDGIRITGFSPSANFLITVIAHRTEGDLIGATAWKSSGGDRRAYRDATEAHRGAAE